MGEVLRRRADADPIMSVAQYLGQPTVEIPTRLGGGVGVSELGSRASLTGGPAGLVWLSTVSSYGRSRNHTSFNQSHHMTVHSPRWAAAE